MLKRIYVDTGGYTVMQQGWIIYYREFCIKGAKWQPVNLGANVVEKDLIYLGCHSSNTELNNSRGTKNIGMFVLIAKTQSNNLVVMRCTHKYRVLLACNTVEDMQAFYKHLVPLLGTKASYGLENLGEKNMWFRGARKAFEIYTNDYITYKSLIFWVPILINRHPHLCINMCNNAMDTESQMLWALDIYACTHIHVVVKQGTASIRKCTEAEIDKFVYVPRIAGFDNEMLTVDSLDPNAGLYMNSYYCDGIVYVLYTKTFCREEFKIQEDAGLPYKIVCIVCEDSLHLVETWFKLVYLTRPDAITGYFAYHADFPALRGPLARKLKFCPVDDPVGIVPYIEETKKLDKRSADSERGIVFTIPGIAMVDMYSYLAKNIPNEQQADMTLDNMARIYLDDNKVGVGYDKLLHNYYSDKLEDKIETIVYAAHDAYLPVGLYKKFEVWQRQQAMFKITGVHPHKHLTTGMVLQIYGALLIELSTRNTFVDTPISRGIPPGGGMVPEPLPGLHKDVYVLDVTMMYPHIVMQYKIDPSNVYRSTHGIEGRPCVELKDKDGTSYYFCMDVDPPFPSMLEKLKDKRMAIKDQVAALKKQAPVDNDKIRLLTAQEEAVKEAANSAVGALAETASGTNPILCAELNDVVTTTGRLLWTIIAEMATELGFEVVYGDTDSIFVKGQGDIQELINTLHNNLPEKIRLKLEYKATSAVVLKKKHYICLQDDGKIKIAGYKSVKSSAPPVCRTVFAEMVEILLKQGRIAMEQAYEAKLEQIKLVTDITQIAWKVKHTGKTLSDRSAKKQLLDRLASRGITFMPGEIKYMVYVYTREHYFGIYGVHPPVELPSLYGLKKMPSIEGISTELEYCIEEIQDMSVVNVAAVVARFCLRNLDEIKSVVPM